MLYIGLFMLILAENALVFMVGVLFHRNAVVRSKSYRRRLEREADDHYDSYWLYPRY